MSGNKLSSIIDAYLLMFIPMRTSTNYWVDVSYQYTKKQIQITSQFQPEIASSNGITEADDLCSNITKAHMWLLI